MKWITGTPRRIAALAVCCALLAMTAACNRGGEEAGRLKDEPRFTVAVTEMLDSLNPFTAEGKLAQEFFLLVYDPLWRIGADGEPVNCLVEDYSQSSDQLTWTIRLRQDVTFSNGTRLTSSDVQYSYQMMALHSEMYDACCDGIVDIRCPDERTVVITTSYVKGDMRLCPVPILPKSVWNQQGSVERYENAEMIGSGPFVRLLEDQGPRDVSWVFQARTDYFGGEPHIGTLCFEYYATETGAARALSTGGADAAIGMTDVQLVTLEGVPGVQLVQGVLPGSDIWTLAFNTRSDLFSNVSLRQMVESCLDRSMILSMSSGDAGRVGSVFASPATDYFYTLPVQRPVDYNAARNSLYLFGYDDIDADGLMESRVTREDMVIRLYTSENDDWASTAATVLEGDLAQIGVTLRWTTTEGDVRDICTPKANWDMCLLNMNGNIDPVLAACDLRDYGSLTGWQSDNFDALLERLRICTDPASVQSYAGQLQQTVYDESVYIFLAYANDIQGIRRDRWTGYEDVLDTAGGLFGTGSVDAYMSIAPLAS